MKAVYISFALILFWNTVDCRAKKKFGCIVPKEPVYGTFQFRKNTRSLRITCEPGFTVQGIREKIYCVRGQWDDKLLFEKPVRYLDLQQSCAEPYGSSKLCPPLKAPRNGNVIHESRAIDGKATFRCDQGFILDPDDAKERFCYAGRKWGGEQPVCRKLQDVKDLTELIEDKVIAPLSSATVNSEDGEVQSKLAAGKSGLDIIFALDVSASIGAASLEIAKNFIKLLVKTFGVSPQAHGGKNGTRVGLFTFSSQADLIFGLEDPDVRSEQAVFQKIDAIQGAAGGTNFFNLLTEVNLLYYNIIESDDDRSKHATRALFILTDAEDTSGNNIEDLDSSVIANAEALKEKNFEIFTVGVGLNIDHLILSKIASKPNIDHVFLINEMADLDKMADYISEKNKDYGQCGVSGNTETAQESGSVKKGAWPWIGWVNVFDRDSPKTCGGYLVCQRYFITTATCVTVDDGEGNFTIVDNDMIWKPENGHIPRNGDPDEMSPSSGYTMFTMTKEIVRMRVTLGDHNLYKLDSNEIQVRVSHIEVHPEFTNEANVYGVKDYDIALLDFGEDKEILPIFSKYIRPICMGSSLNSSVYAGSKNMLTHLKYNWLDTLKKGFVVGWGHKTELSMDLPEEILRQNRRTAHTNKRCRKIYPELDTNKFFCVGNRKESNDCKKSDIGGPYMEEIKGQYAVLGMTLSTKKCDEEGNNFSIFLNTLKKDIVTWLELFLSECNRANMVEPTEPPPA